MAITTNDKNLGHATAYAYAKSKSYTGTEEEFAELMASYATVAESAEESRQAAEVAQGKAEDAQAAAETAQGIAVQAKDTAVGAKDTATSAATTATTKAGEASASATSASESASAAAGSATSAGNSATNAASSATAAQTARTGAETAQTASETAQDKAETAQGAAEAAAESVSASAAQIATNTADISDLRSDLINKAEKSITLTQIPFTITKNKYLDPNGNEVSKNYYALLTADLTGISGSLRICSYVGYNNAKYAFYDANDTVIAKGNRSGTEDAFVDDVQIPSGATKVKVSGRTINVVAIPKVCHLAYVDEMNNINGGEFTSLLVPNAFADIAYSWSSGSFVYNNNSFVESDSVQFMEINVAEGEFYRITGENYYSFNIIGYANNNNASNITWIPNASNKKSIDMVLQIPKGIDCLIVQRDALKTTTIKKATGYADGRIFLGKKIAIIGDSTVEKNATATMKWHDNIALETGLEVVNLGVSGTGYKSGEGSNRAYYQRLSDVPSDCDAVVIFGSGNDNAQTIGTITDTTTDTVCGCVNKTINDLISLYPTIKIGVITAYPWRSFKPSTANAMQTIANDIVEICKGNSIPVLDLYHCSNLRPWIEENDEALFANADGCHINDVGHAIITPMILEFIKTLLTSY